MTELKPCPFCGGDAKITDSARGQYKHRVQCTRCGVSSPGTAYRNDSWNTKQWNTRADDWQPIDTAPRDGVILVYSPDFIRVVDAQFAKLCRDATHWRRIRGPEDKA